MMNGNGQQQPHVMIFRRGNTVQVLTHETAPYEALMALYAAAEQIRFAMFKETLEKEKGGAPRIVVPSPLL